MDSVAGAFPQYGYRTQDRTVSCVGGALLRLSTSDNLVFSSVLILGLFLYQPGIVNPACLGGEQCSDVVILLCHLALGLLSEFN